MGWREEAGRCAGMEVCVKEEKGVCDGGGQAAIDAVEEEQLKGRQTHEPASVYSTNHLKLSDLASMNMYRIFSEETPPLAIKTRLHNNSWPLAIFRAIC